MSGRLQRLGLVAAGIVIGVLLAAGTTGLAFGFNRAAVADLFGSNLIRAQVVVYQGGQDSEIWLNRGKIQQASATSITIREKDGQVDRFDIAPGARVTLNNSPVSPSVLRKGMQAQVFRPGDAPATRVDVTLR